jgi:hypothetical protein
LCQPGGAGRVWNPFLALVRFVDGDELIWFHLGAFQELHELRTTHSRQDLTLPYQEVVKGELLMDLMA